MEELRNYYNSKKIQNALEAKASPYKGQMVSVKSRNYSSHAWVSHGEMLFETAIKKGRNFEFFDTVSLSLGDRLIAHWQVLSPPVFY